MKNHSVVVATYKSHDDAAAALKTLQYSGFDMQQLSLVERNQHTEADMVGFSHTSDRLKYWGEIGAIWGGIWGMLIGTGFFFIPGIGPLLVAGPLVGMIVGALEGGVVVGGLSVLCAGLYSLGIHKDTIMKYETALKSGKFIVMAHGSAEETIHAREILNRTNPEALERHQ